MASTSSCALRSSTCASSRRAFSPFSRSADFSRSCPSSATFSLAATRFRSNPMRALLEIAPRPIELADLVLVVEHLPLFGVERVAQVEDVLLFLVDDLAQPQELALLGEGGRLREPLARLLDLLAQRLPLVLQRVNPRLQLGVARLGLARRARRRRAGGPKLSEMTRPLASVETSSKAISSGAGGTSCSFVGACVPAPRPAARRRPAAPGPASRRSGRRRDRDPSRSGTASALPGPGRPRAGPVDLARRLLPGQVRRQIVVGPEVPQIDHVAARRRILGRARLQRREGRLGLRIELLALERGVGDAVVRQDLLSEVSRALALSATMP